MHRPTYSIGRAIARYVGSMFVHHRVIHPQRLRRPGAFLLACTHIGHLEPVLLTTALQRPVHWVARIEFYRHRWAAEALRRFGAIPVNRFGVPTSTFHHCLDRLAAGQIVGIFPEGGRTHGANQAINGGPIKGGVCVIAERAQVPIVPVVVLDIDTMHAITPWIPGQRTAIRTIVGEPIFPSPSRDRSGRRQRRIELTKRLADAFMLLHAEGQAFTGGRL